MNTMKLRRDPHTGQWMAIFESVLVRFVGRGAGPAQAIRELADQNFSGRMCSVLHWWADQVSLGRDSQYRVGHSMAAIANAWARATGLV